MQSEKDLEEYCNSLLDIKSQTHKKFLKEIKKKHRICKFFKNFIDLCYSLIKSFSNASFRFSQPKINI